MNGKIRYTHTHYIAPAFLSISIVRFIAKPIAGFSDPPVISEVIVKQHTNAIAQNNDIRDGSLMFS